MPITVTWNDGASPETSFTVPDDVLASLDSLRQTITTFQPNGYVPKYATVKDLIVGTFVEALVMPALARFPTAGIQAAQENLAAAQAALQQAQASAIPGFAQ